MNMFDPALKQASQRHVQIYALYEIVFTLASLFDYLLATTGEFDSLRNVLDQVPTGASAEIEMKRAAMIIRDSDDALLVVKSETGGGY